MSDLLRDFETACERVGVSPAAALKAGGVHPTLWWKWKTGRVSPTFASFEKAKRGLDAIAPRGRAA